MQLLLRNFGLQLFFIRYTKPSNLVNIFRPSYDWDERKAQELQNMQAQEDTITILSTGAEVLMYAISVADGLCSG